MILTERSEFPIMPDTQTSPEIIALILLALAFTLYAWWLSDRQSRRFRKLLSWVQDNYAAQWQALPWSARNINRVGGVEQLRRNGLRDDPDFMEQYRHCKSVRWAQVAALLCAVAAFALLAVGIEYFGWTF